MARFDDETPSENSNLKPTRPALIRELTERKLKQPSGPKKLKKKEKPPWNGLCPILRAIKNPSLVVNRVKNVLNCLARAVVCGDVFKWVMHARNNFVPPCDRTISAKQKSAALCGNGEQSGEHSPSHFSHSHRLKPAEGRTLLSDVAKY